MRKNKELPRQSMATLIRKAYAARYGLMVRINKDGRISARQNAGLCNSHIGDWTTSRNDAGCVLLRHRDCLFFKFGPDS